MSNIQRYQPSLEWIDNDAFPHVTEDPEGDYVLHSDHAAELARVDLEHLTKIGDVRHALETLEDDYRKLNKSACELRTRAERAENANALLRAECEAWREVDTLNHTPCQSIENGDAYRTAKLSERLNDKLHKARAATDEAGALKGVES